MQELGKQTGLTIAQIVLSYLLGEPLMTIALIGCQTIDQLDDSVTAARIRLTRKQINYIETGIEKGRNIQSFPI